ncbi:unnamed protein product [Anisakis simplex]|uniref:Sodium-dependent multivitamin transporter (inferred by orthology to a human protein) n=1 Tax=Anisakis simplex TaxID=6269 RepID=A0A0M3KB32_ANISI|nr:unnamed protein product [Anisakis simplex]
MYVGLFTLIIKGTIEVGGISKVFETSYETGRLTKAMARFSPTPFQYQSVWIMLFGTFMDWMSYYGLNQMALQRYCSMPSLKNARIVMAMTVPAFTLIGWMCCYIGLLMLTYFSGCDPLLTGEVSTKDEMNVLMATRILSFLPGFQGLFLSSLFSSTLSTVSSGMNSMTAVIYEDFIKGSTHRAIKDRNSTCVNRMITLVIGILTTALAFACQVLGGTFNAATSTLGATAGPLAGVFCLGIFFPKANKYGAFIGLACSILLTVTCSTSYNIVRQYDDYMYPLPTERSPTCSNLSMSKNPYLNLNNSETFHDRSDLHFGRSGTLIFSQVSVFLYAAIGVCSVFVIGAIASLLLPYNADPAKRRMAYACTYKGLKVPFRRVNRSTNYKVNLDQIKPLDKS